MLESIELLLVLKNIIYVRVSFTNGKAKILVILLASNMVWKDKKDKDLTLSRKKIHLYYRKLYKIINRLLQDLNL